MIDITIRTDDGRTIPSSAFCVLPASALTAGLSPRALVVYAHLVHLIGWQLQTEPTSALSTSAIAPCLLDEPKNGC